MDFADAKAAMAEINAALDHVSAQKAAISAAAATAPDWEPLELDRREFEQAPVTDQREFLALALQRIDFFQDYLVITYPFPTDSSGTRQHSVPLPLKSDGYIKLAPRKKAQS